MCLFVNENICCLLYITMLKFEVPAKAIVLSYKALLQVLLGSSGENLTHKLESSTAGIEMFLLRSSKERIVEV